MTLDELREKYPDWNIYQGGDPECKCKGSGEISTPSGRTQPCLCVCLSQPHGDDKRSFMRELGVAASALLAQEDKDDGK